MKKSIKTVIVGLLFVPVLALGMSLSTQVALAENPIQNGVNSTGDNTTCLFTKTVGADGKDLAVTAAGYCKSGIFSTIVNTALFIIGAISVLMLIYGGIRYTISMGDAKNVEAAKNTIMYAIIGIVVALLAFAIVNFVLTSLIK